MDAKTRLIYAVYKGPSSQGYGTLLRNAMAAADQLAEQGVEATVLRLLEVQPLPMAQIAQAVQLDAPLIVVEEASGNCGIRESLAYELHQLRPEMKVKGLDLGCRYIRHGAVDMLQDHYGIGPNAVVNLAREVLGYEN